MEILTLILIGISLSIDAFCVSLVYGLVGINTKKIIISSLIVGTFHFLMPLIGNIIGINLLDSFKINPKYLMIIILSFILIQMIKSLNEEEKNININYLNIVFLSFIVSIDSFTIGIGLNYIINNIFYASIIFAFISGSFTFLGCILGSYTKSKLSSISKYIGIFILVILILYFIF